MTIRKKQEKSEFLIEYIIFGVIAIICFFSFQQGDILHTGGSSFAYLNGHILDFYEYNATVLGGNNYLPSSYILFALWNIPIRLLNLVTEPTLTVPTGVLMWYKLLPVIFYCFSGYLIYLIAVEMKLNKVNAKFCALLFLMNPIGFFSQFIFGQYDIFTVFFVLLGMYFYFKDDTRKFILFFGIASTFKYFPLFVFVPFVLLKEKNILRIIKSGILVTIPILLEVIIYIGSVAFRTGVFGFGATSYIFNAKIDTGYYSISLIVLLWALVCLGAYLKNVENKQDVIKWSLFFANLIMFLLFGLSMWHPQWLLFMVPFMTLGLVINKRSDLLLMLDIVLMVLFCVFTVNQWQNHVDQQLFNLGVLSRFIKDDINSGLTIRGLYKFSDMNLIMSLFSSVLLISSLLKLPKYSVKNLYESDFVKKRKLIIARFLIGIGFFVIPAFLCFFQSALPPYCIVDMGKQIDNIGPIENGRQVTQVFMAESDSISEINVLVGTYARVNQGEMFVEIWNENNCLYKTMVKLQAIKDNEYLRIKLPKVSVKKGETYEIRFISNNLGEDFITIYNSDIVTETQYAIVDNLKQPYSLCIKIYGE